MFKVIYKKLTKMPRGTIVSFFFSYKNFLSVTDLIVKVWNRKNSRLKSLIGLKVTMKSTERRLTEAFFILLKLQVYSWSGFLCPNLSKWLLAGYSFFSLSFLCLQWFYYSAQPSHAQCWKMVKYFENLPVWTP